MEEEIKNTYAVLHSGRCKCIYEPRGDYGLEGFQLNKFYDYEMRESPKYGKYFKINCGDVFNPTYGQTCTPRAFNKFFGISGDC